MLTQIPVHWAASLLLIICGVLLKIPKSIAKNIIIATIKIPQTNIKLISYSKYVNRSLPSLLFCFFNSHVLHKVNALLK